MKDIMKKLAIVAILLVAGCGMKLTPTPEKVYAEETRRLKIVKEHQMLNLEVMKINAAIAQMNAAAGKNKPAFNLAPEKTE